MAAPSLTLVNQKIAYCRALLKLLVREREPANANERLRQQALLEGAMFHLLCAHRHYLRELAENYSVPDAAQIATEQDLLDALERFGKNPSEARELLNLRVDRNSWVSALQEAYDGCWAAMGAPAVARIQVVDLDAPDGVPGKVTLDRLNQWFRAFNELVERQRETSAEY